jgi:hypothetical protein
MMTSRHWVVTSSVVCAVLLTRVASLRADTITILSPGTEPTNVSILADTFTLFGSSVSVDLDFLMSRGHFALPIQTGDLSVGNSGFANQVFDIFVPQRQVIVGGVTRGVIISGGQLSITPQNR